MRTIRILAMLTAVSATGAWAQTTAAPPASAMTETRQLSNILTCLREHRPSAVGQSRDDAARRCGDPLFMGSSLPQSVYAKDLTCAIVEVRNEGARPVRLQVSLPIMSVWSVRGLRTEIRRREKAGEAIDFVTVFGDQISITPDPATKIVARDC
jgi:hypothetical protein